MKLLRFFFVGVAVIAALVIVVLVLALTPAVQTWAARRVLSGQPDLTAQLDRAAVGLNHSEITGVRIAKPGLVLTLPSATLDFSLFSAARKKVAIKRLVAKGWTVDLTAPVPAGGKPVATAQLQRTVAETAAQPQPAADASAAKAVVFDGVFNLLRLPVDLSVDEIDLEGEVIFPSAAGKPAGRAQVKIVGGKLGAGRDGRVTFTAKAALAEETAAVSQVEANSVVGIRMDTPRSFESVTVTAEVKATGRKFPQGTSLHAELVLTGGARGENYAVTVQAPGADHAKKLLDISVSFPAGALSLSGKWKIDAANADVAPFTFGRPLPVFAAAGEGVFDLGRTLETMHATGRIDSTVEQLELVQTELAALGRIRGQLDFDLAKEAGVLRIERLSGAISGVKPIASVQALQRIDFDLQRGELKVADPAAELLRLTLHGLPVAWAQPFIKDFSVGGDDLRGEFFASARNGGFAVRPSAPVTLTNLAVSQAGQPLVRALDVAITLTADYTPQGWQADVSDFSMRSGGTALLTASAKAGQPAGPRQPLKATGRYEANLPALLLQPAAARFAVLSQGVARGDFSASIDATKQIQARLELVGAVAGAKPLPRVQADLRIDLQPDGTLDAQVPLFVEAAGRKSDLRLTARVKPAATTTNIDAEVQSDALFVEDLKVFQALSAVLPPEPAAPKQPAPSGPPPPDKVPFWSACTGQVRLALKEVVYSPDVKISNVTGSLKIEPGAITLEGIRAGLGAGGEATLSGKMGFEAGAADPYSFNGDATVTGFDPGPFFRASDPQKPPTVEGKFNMTSKLAGTAPNSASLAGMIKAEVSLTSREGVFRGLALPSAFADKFKGKNGNLLSNIGGVVGALAGSKTGDVTQVAADLVTLLAEPHYDQLSMQLSHDTAAGLIRLSDFTLISPKLRLSGNGSILRQEGVPLLKQPLTAELDMSVHGDLADLLGRNGMLRGGADTLGYSPLFSPVKVDGTLAEVGTQALMNMLMQKLLSTPTNPFGNLFGK